MTLWVRSVVFGALLDVRFTPEADIRADVVCVRYPLPT